MPSKKKQNVKHDVDTATVFAESTRAVQDIHQAIADVPFAIMDRLGVLDKSGDEIKKLHDDTVGIIYDTVRNIGDRVVSLADDLGTEVMDVVVPQAENAAKQMSKAV